MKLELYTKVEPSVAQSVQRGSSQRKDLQFVTPWLATELYFKSSSFDSTELAA